jgi:glyoxylase-like metal-dependent hydrolase (beta-lactamase superfamily II)
MLEIIPVTGCTGAECYLLVSESRGFLVDTGYACCAGVTVKNIAEALGPRPLDYILLTHSHYDHVGGLTEVRRAWPSAVAVASRHAKEILSRQGARDMIRSLDGKAAAKRGIPEARGDYTAGFAVDRTVVEGDILRAGGISVAVMETPGHTRCCLSYYFREDGLLVLSESTGIRPNTRNVSPEFIVSYRGAMAAIDRSENLAARRILIAHSGTESGDGAAEYFRDARAAARTVAEWVLAEHRRGKNPDEIAESYAEKFYTESADNYQPFEAFMLNARGMIPRLIGELGKD